MKYSAAQAGKAVGRSTATITRAIEKHRLSAVKDENGAWRIDPAELHRVFDVKKPANPSMQSDEKPRNGEALQHDVEILAEKLRALEGEREREREQWADQVADLRARLDDAATKLDREGEERRRLTAILTDQRDKPAPAPEKAPAGAPVARERGWWSKLWGTAAND